MVEMLGNVVPQVIHAAGLKSTRWRSSTDRAPAANHGYPGNANLMAKITARITTAGFASPNLPAISLAKA